jgi:hypothetical protein
MGLTLCQAMDLLERRNRAFVAADLEAFLALWTEDCQVDGPEHLLVGKEALRERMRLAWDVGFEPVHMEVGAVAVRNRTIFYEWVFTGRLRADGGVLVDSGMTAHEVAEDGRFHRCREYFDPPAARRPSALDRPAVRAFEADRDG